MKGNFHARFLRGCGRVNRLHLPGADEHVIRRMNRSAWIVLVVALVAIFSLSRRFHIGGSHTIQYRGETFDLSRAYSSYEDYKDDPNNLATNELSRIERAITNAPFPSSFASEVDLARAVLHLKFPGYGCGGRGSFPQSDGSTCSVFSVEIPMRDRERYFIGRNFAGKVSVIDDFVMALGTNAITQVRIDGGRLLYYDGRGALLREKQM